MVVNPIKRNQVQFWQRGRLRVGWIGRSTGTRYRIDYKRDPQQREYSHVWRRKDEVEFMVDGRRRKNWGCASETNPPASLVQAAHLSKRFHGFTPRRVSRFNVTWPKAVALLGHVVRIDYLSDKKDGVNRIYFHEFEHPPALLAPAARGDKKNLLLLRGRFAIKSEGIVG